MPPLLLSTSGSGVCHSTCTSNPSALQSSSGLHPKIHYSKPPLIEICRGGTVLEDFVHCWALLSRCSGSYWWHSQWRIWTLQTSNKESSPTFVQSTPEHLVPISPWVLSMKQTVLQWHWILKLILLEPFHKSKKGTLPCFIVSPKFVGGLVSESKEYHQCHLVGYPLKMRYPTSASDLQQWHTWDARKYESYEKAENPDLQQLEVKLISETLVFKLISAFLIGSENHDGETFLLKFEAYKYHMCSNSSSNYNHQSSIYDSSEKQEEVCWTCCSHWCWE